MNTLIDTNILLKFSKNKNFYFYDLFIKAKDANWYFFRKSNVADIELVRETAISNISIEYITRTANAKTEFVPLRHSFRFVKYGQWFVDEIDFTYARVYGLVWAATSCRWIRRYSLNRHPCTLVGQTIIDTGAVGRIWSSSIYNIFYTGIHRILHIHAIGKQ